MQPTPIDAFKLAMPPSPPPSAAGQLEANARLRFAVAQALAQGRMEFHYQPVVRAGSPRFPAFFESLARMRTPDGGLVAAGAFMPAVEAGPIGRAVDRLALAEALRTLAARPGLRLSINMSPLSMGDADWLAILDEGRLRHPGICARLIVEITESEAMRDVGQTIDFMEHVRAAGCAFALDDFGAGATCFKYFRDFRFDFVKIDGAFVRGVHAARDAQVLVECLHAVARHFEMVSVAERVDDPAEADWLARLGIDCLQGYLFGRPGPLPALPGEPEQESRRIAG
jgi:EAL domain-containing protein (putative c-di-GMP-specific phosphodiesterase class I)